MCITNQAKLILAMSSQQPNPRNTRFMLAMPDCFKKAAYIDEFSEKMMAPKK